MGDLIGEQLEGTLYYADKPTFDALFGLGLTPDVEAAVFADLCRINALYMIARAGSGHIGSTFSSLDIVSHVLLRALPEAAAAGEPPGLYFSSKGHDAPGLYAALVGTGRLPVDQLHRLRRLGGLPGHPDVATEGIVTNTGSLGMGISKAKGMVRAQRRRGERRRIFVLTGDGELQEGQIWESLAGAVAAQMDEVVVIVDCNKLQSDTYVRATSDLGDLVAKFRAFGFHVAQVDGHDHGALGLAFGDLGAVRGLPQVLIADTIKGAGVSFMEHTALIGDAPLYRYHSGAPDAESYHRALAELSQRVQMRLSGSGVLPSLQAFCQPASTTPATKKVSLVAAYSEALVSAAERRSDLWVLDADLAVDMGLMPFKERFPERFVECGIAEMDMVSQAGGMALRGQLPICHSFACFLTTRANEQIYNNASERTRVLYVGGLSGLLPAAPGHSHQGVRDVSVLGSIPGMTCIQPADGHEVRLALEYALSEASGPVYLRLCSLPVALSFKMPQQSRLVRGQGVCLRQGSDGVIIAHGPVMLSEAFTAAERLAAACEVDLAVYALPFLNCVDKDWLIQLVGPRRFLFTIDDHYLDGSQGQLIASLLPELGLAPVLGRFGLSVWPACGAADEVLRHHGLDADSLVEGIRARIRATRTLRPSRAPSAPGQPT